MARSDVMNDRGLFDATVVVDCYRFIPLRRMNSHADAEELANERL